MIVSADAGTGMVLHSSRRGRVGFLHGQDGVGGKQRGGGTYGLSSSCRLAVYTGAIAF